MNPRYGFHATVTAHPGQGDALVALLLDAPALTHPDCAVFLISRSADDPDTVHVTEGWASAEAHRAFLATDRAQAVLAATQALVQGESRYTTAVPVGGKAAF